MRRNPSLLPIIVLVAAVAAVILLPRIAWRGTRANQESFSSGSAFPTSVTDCRGAEIVIKRKPVRIVSLSPAVTEILFAIGAGNRVVADTDYCHFPQAAAKLPKVGGYLDPNPEKITAFAPDLVLLAKGTKKDVVDRLTSIGLTTVVVDPVDLAGTSKAIRLVGRAVGNTAQADQLAKSLDARCRAITSKTENLPDDKRPRTLFLFDLKALFTAGVNNHIDDLITKAGGRNIADKTGIQWPELSMETVVAQDPQVILLLEGHGNHNDYTTQSALKILRADRRWQSVLAVKTGKIVILDDDIMTLPGPRLIQGLEATARALHPELWGKSGVGGVRGAKEAIE
jgi:iron complex transport system substrate-binding protein